MQTIQVPLQDYLQLSRLVMEATAVLQRIEASPAAEAVENPVPMVQDPETGRQIPASALGESSGDSDVDDEGRFVEDVGLGTPT